MAPISLKSKASSHQCSYREKEQCENPRLLANLVIGDEGGFALNDKVSAWNICEYAPIDKPRWFNYDRPNSRHKLTVWDGSSGHGQVLGPFSFAGNVTYLKVINVEILYYPVGIYLLKVNNKNTRTRYETLSKLTIKTPEWRHWRRSGVFIVNFEHISNLVLVFLLLTLNM